MIATLKSEFRKLFTVRSTYVILLLCLGVLGLFSFYGLGLGADPASLQDKNLFSTAVTNAISLLSVFVSLIAVLLVTHEYRYNTIMYSLTTSRSRFKIMVAKFTVISLLAVVISLVVGVLSPLFVQAGLALRGLHLVSQEINLWDLLWRGVFVGWGTIVIGMMWAWLIRNQVGALGAIFLFPGMVEQLLTMLLKEKAVYLPYAALSNVENLGAQGSLTPGKSALVFLAYLVVGWVISLVLLVRRDAN